MPNTPTVVSSPTSPSTPPQLATNPLWRRPVLVGTVKTLPGLHAQLVQHGISPAGWVFVPDSPTRIGQHVPERAPVPMGVPVTTLDELARFHDELLFTAAIVSVPARMEGVARRARTALGALGIPERLVQAFEDILSASSLAPLAAGTHTTTPTHSDMAELIGRTPYGVDRRSVASVLEGKRVLITGAGGSIGSELARIAATFKPELLILMERAENSLFEIDRQLARRFPGVPRKAVLHDVVDEAATLRVLKELRPSVVFHAAAHKHVPLMEDHPGHAVVNNLFGTKSIADAAVAAGAERFVMISSDKAVNPTSVMGATKRLAEMYVQSLNAPGAAGHISGTFCTMVRFGNVLGSACSVLPIWSQQLAEGGPITVTDPRMTRYFMTIHEAATLVIQAAVIAPGTEATNGLNLVATDHARAETRGSEQPTIFVLDMGEPVRILDLAQRFVRLHGFEPIIRDQANASSHLDLAQSGPTSVAAGTAPGMDIVLSGARPGEKLFEELQYGAEALAPTHFPGILALVASAGGIAGVTAMMGEFTNLKGSTDHNAILDAIRRHVPEMAKPMAASRAA